MAISSSVMVREVLRTWNTRSDKPRTEYAYIAYCVVLVGLIVGAPALRAIWLLLAEPQTMAALSSLQGSSLVVASVAAILSATCATWLSPVARRGFLASVLADSSAPVSRAFRGPLFSWLILAVVLSAGSASLFFSVSLAFGRISAIEFCFALIGAFGFALLAFALAILSQGSRLFAAGASTLLAFIAVGIALMRPEWAMTALVSPVWALCAVVAGVSASAYAALSLNRMHPEAITAASLRRDAATAGLALMDADDVSRALVEQPSVGRRLLAVPRLPALLAFPYSALIGSLRTPERLIRGVLVTASGLVLAALSTSSWMAAGGAVLIFAGLSAMCGGVRYAADVVRSAPVFGVSDGFLLGAHALLPLVTVFALSPLALLLAPTSGWLIAVGAGLSAVVARIFAALTPEAPVQLLVPIPTPAGDLAAMLRLMWAVQGPLFAAVVAG